MSEKLYRLLLRLYPSRFRTHYAGEAMQVFRDRLRDERGVLKRVRLWLDVLLDVFLSAPREHSRAASHSAPSPTGLPSFLVLEEEPLRPDKFLMGTVLAVLALGTFVYLMTHGGNRVHFPGLSNEPLRSIMAPAATANTVQRSASPSQTPSPVPALTAAERQFVIRKVSDAVRTYDAYPTESQDLAEFLAEQESFGNYSEVTNGSVLAQLLTRQINGFTRHVSVTVLCGQEPAPASSLWTVPPNRRATVWRRIDAHFSVTVAPVEGSLGLRR